MAMEIKESSKTPTSDGAAFLTGNSSDVMDRSVRAGSEGRYSSQTAARKALVPLTGSRDALTASSNSVFSQGVDGGTAVVCADGIVQCCSCEQQDDVLPLRTYCSPRIDRRQRSGSYPVREQRYNARDLSSLSTDGYLKLKAKGRTRMDSGESRESADTLDNVSHISTCATSDYAFMTSQDTMNLCRSCACMCVDTVEPVSSDRPVSLTVSSYQSVRRTYSNPEQCHTQSHDESETAHCSTLKARTQLHTCTQPVAAIHTSTDQVGTLQCQNHRHTTSHHPIASLTGAAGMCEDNALSRVSRWLTNMEPQLELQHS